MREDTREQKSYRFIHLSMKRVIRLGMHHKLNEASMAVQELDGALWYAKWVGDLSEEEYNKYTRILRLAGSRYMIP